MNKYFNAVCLKRFASVLSFGVIILFLILNALTPLIADDYSYSLGRHSLFDVAKTTYDEYFNWGGRIFAFLSGLACWLQHGKCCCRNFLAVNLLLCDKGYQ